MGMRRVCSWVLLSGLVFLGMPMAAPGQSFGLEGNGAKAAPARELSARRAPGPFDAAPWLNAGSGESGSFRSWISGDRASGNQAGGDEDRVTEGYHWKGLLWQSLGFISIENGWRLSTDGYLRKLVFHGPYWRNYAISLQHWDMTRWSDGDDFLVDNIGHPMQGAVSAYIEIQNSPTDRVLRFSNTSPYWKSRMKALLWATAYSTQQKIGPLGEAAVGNAGGYTYGLDCNGQIPCRNPNAKYTNNTGWTDFIMTPAGGTVWVVGEDLLDRFVSDRVMAAHPDSVFPKILRGSLNPTRTMANALRGKLPWYRDVEHPYTVPEIAEESPRAAMIASLPRYEIFPHFDGISIPVNTAECQGCRRWMSGGGVGFSARLTRWVDFDSDVDYHSNVSPQPSSRSGGNLLMATVGLRTGFETPRYALKFSVRPGFVSYDQAYVTLPSEENPTPAIGRVTHFATALAVNGDYGLTRHLALRGVMGNTPVRYLGHFLPAGPGTAPNFNWLSPDYFVTNGNWMYQVGPVLRF